MARKPLATVLHKDSISNLTRERMEVPNLFVRCRVSPPDPYRQDALTFLEMSLNKISKFIKSEYGKKNNTRKRNNPKT